MEKEQLEDEDKIRMDIEESQQTTLPCTLCYVETYGRGIFTGEKGDLGAEKDKFRIIIYPLCRTCSFKVGYKDEVKRKILSEYN